MLNLLVSALIAVLVIAVVWVVASLFLPHSIALVLTLVVAILCLIYLARQGPL